MHFFEYYYENIIKYELINKYCYKNINQLPKLKKIILNFGCQNSDLKNLVAILLSLELITEQSGVLTISKKSNILLKIQKGNPVGCKVILKKTIMYKFFHELICECFLKLKNFIGFQIKHNKTMKNTISINIQNSLIFSKLEKNYYLFNKLPILNITLVTNTFSSKELLFLLKLFKLPLNNK